jgi:hypothetical protein
VAHLAPVFVPCRVQYVQESAIGCSHPNPDVCRRWCDAPDVKNVCRWIKPGDVEPGSRTPSGHRQGRALRFARKPFRLSRRFCAAAEGGSRPSVPVPASATAASDEESEKHQGDDTHLPTVRRASHKSPASSRRRRGGQRAGRNACETAAAGYGVRVASDIFTPDSVENFLYIYGPLAFSLIVLITALLWRRDFPRTSGVFIILGAVCVVLSGLWFALLYAWDSGPD